MTPMKDARLNEDGLVLEDGYADSMQELVIPYLQEHRTDQRVPGFGGKPLAVSRFDAEEPLGTVMIIHGFTSVVDKYDEIIFSLLQNGWSVLAYDQRGHGRSWRDERISDNSLVHVEHFEDYVRDLEIICSWELADMPGPHVLFSHSMGGAVSGLFLEKHGDVFDRAVFCAPMIAPRRGGTPLPVIIAICLGMKMLGKGRERPAISKPYSGPENYESSYATGQARFNWYSELRDRTPEYHTNGPTYQWTLEAMNVTAKLLKPGAVERIGIPVRIYGAENDGAVVQEKQQKFADRLKDGNRKVIIGAKHEIYRSKDEVLFPWWHEVLEFFAETGESGEKAEETYRDEPEGELNEEEPAEEEDEFRSEAEEMLNAAEETAEEEGGVRSGEDNSQEEGKESRDE